MLMQGVTSPTASVLVMGNPALTDISALSCLGGCAGIQNPNPILVQVKLSTGVQCALTTWKGVCAYIAAYAGGNAGTCPAS